MNRRLRHQSSSTTAISLLAIALLACSDTESRTSVEPPSGQVQQQDSESVEVQDRTASDAAKFFADLPRAATVSEEEMGDLYFKILTRLATKLRAVSNEESARSARAIIDYARSEVSVLVDRAEALTEADRSQLFQNSVAQMTFAKRQYKKAVERLAGKNEAYLQNLAEYADKPWPSLR